MVAALLALAAVLFCGSAHASDLFLAAADFSDLAYFDSLGVTYKDGGQVRDGLDILQRHGLNCVRLRLFTSSAAQAASDPYNYGNNLAYNLPLALRVKNAGLLFSLDFHYSDTWADPGHQATPSAWAGLTFAQLVPQMRSYNSNTIAAFAAEGAMPDYVQIGNEITAGMLWPLGQVPGTNAAVQWSQLGQLMNAAIQGIRDAAGASMPRIIIHIDRGGDWATTEWFFDNLKAQGVAFDIIGESYYPFYHGPLTNLNICLSNAAVRYGKPVIVAETAFPWNNTYWTTNIFGFVPSTNGQVSYIAALAQIVKGVTNQLGAGVFYWGAEYQAADGVNEAGFNTASFFDAGGNVLPVADAVGGIGAPLYLGASLLGPDLLLQWPFSGAAARLMTSSSLASTAVWSQATNSITNTGPVFTVALPRGGSGFFRLQSN
jgi:arabinogalactan endo-1,4-beta-galactosidase